MADTLGAEVGDALVFAQGPREHPLWTLGTVRLNGGQQVPGWCVYECLSVWVANVCVCVGVYVGGGK